MNKFLLVALSAGFAMPAAAQQHPALTAGDYAHAEAFLGYNTEPLIDHGTMNPNWLSDNRFWYRALLPGGAEFILVDPVKKTKRPAFDHAKLASGLSLATGTAIDAGHLPFQTFSFRADGKAIYFRAAGRSWGCDLNSYQCITAERTGLNTETLPGKNEVVSPDGRKAAFIQDYNLWIKDLVSNQKTQLTTDGVKDFGYATDNAGWKRSEKAILVWSPDSRKIATYRQDQRQVNDMYLVSTNVGKPVLQSWKYALPGDQHIAMITRVIIDLSTAKVTLLNVPADPHRATLSDDISSGGKGLDDVDWTSDASSLAFVSTSRDHRNERFRIADAETGAVKEIFQETVATQFESGQGSINWRYLKKTNEIIWYSERDNWGHLYLYDALTGKVKNQITKGNWVVTKLLLVDEKSRKLYFMAAGKEKSNPYFTHFYSIGFDGKNLTDLSPSPGNHQIMLSTGKRYFIDRYSSPAVTPIADLRDMTGKLVMPLEKTDISRLLAAGWRPPLPFHVKAHDGQTDLYGLMSVPTHLDSSKKYPVIIRIYPGPQGGSVGNWSFSASRGDDQALAELGFVVVALEGSANPLRSKSYHDMNYGNIADNTLPDQITGLRQLAQTHLYIDTNRIGIWGHSGGGFATAAAMFRYPDFFKVGIAESGNHDNRNYEDDWGERYIGLMTKNADGTSNYDGQANQNYAGNLKGKLMLAHGLMDDNVPPYNTMLVVEALTKANKDYDLVVFPNSAHGYGVYSYYMTRRRWDYFVRNLLGADSPQDYLLQPKTDPRTVQ